MSMLSADVLIVEDDEPTQSFLRAICKRQGYTCVTASDGEAGKRQLDGRSEWKIVLLDLYLPKCNGFDVIAYAKQNAPHLLERTIVITAAGEPDVKRVRGLGLVHCVLRKPIDINELAAQMKACSRKPQQVSH